MSSSKRHFTAVVGSKEHGLYISASPSSAARKIVSKLCASSKSKKVEFCVREITQGSKKKTYGPYLGEMKKLAKPIELKGRVIRFDIKVHLKNKKTATKTGKKIGKKMRGGDVRKTGIPSVDDFVIRIIQPDFMRNHITTGNGQGGNRPSFIDTEETDFFKVERNKYSGEPYLFFFPNDARTTFLHEPFIRHYHYLACNSGIGEFKKAIFYNDQAQKIQINHIQKSYVLTNLINFILEQRKQDPRFCNTIYTAVEQELERREEQQKIKNEQDRIVYEKLVKAHEQERLQKNANNRQQHNVNNTTSSNNNQ